MKYFVLLRDIELMNIEDAASIFQFFRLLSVSIFLRLLTSCILAPFWFIISCFYMFFFYLQLVNYNSFSAVYIIISF